MNMRLDCTLCDGDGRSGFAHCPRCHGGGSLRCDACEAPAVAFDDEGRTAVCAACRLDVPQQSDAVQRKATATDYRRYFELSAQRGNVLSKRRKLVVGRILEVRERSLGKPRLTRKRRLGLADGAAELAKADFELVGARLLEGGRLRQVVHEGVERLGGNPHVAAGPFDRAMFDARLAEDLVVDEGAERSAPDELRQVGDPARRVRKVERKPVAAQRLYVSNFDGHDSFTFGIEASPRGRGQSAMGLKPRDGISPLGAGERACQHVARRDFDEHRVIPIDRVHVRRVVVFRVHVEDDSKPFAHTRHGFEI
jgi:hypothetical protein